MGANTLRLKRPSGATLGLSLLFLALLLAAGELLARQEQFQARLVAPRLGSQHRQFEIQMHRLEMLEQREGVVECIFLGNSMVWRGFDPRVFAQAYQERTGQEVQCFNFGVDGMPAASAGALASILVEEYHPQLLIYGTDARDYAVLREARDASVLLDMPWMQYRLGRFNVQGFLFEHAYLYRYREPLRRLLRFDYSQLNREPGTTTGFGLYGFDADDHVGAFVQTIPDPEDEQGLIQYYFSVLSDYQMLPENLAGLEAILSRNQAGVQILLVEMPVPETYMYFFDDEEADYQRFIQRMEEMAADYQVPFWQTTSLNLIPADGWVDYSHLNTRGASVFSAWLGEQIGEAAVQQTIITHAP